MYHFTLYTSIASQNCLSLLCNMGSCYVAACDLKLSLAAGELTNAIRLSCITWWDIEIFPNTAVHCSKMVLMQITWRLFKRFMFPQCNMKQIRVILLAACCPAAVLLRCSALQEQETFHHLWLCTYLLFQKGMLEEMYHGSDCTVNCREVRGNGYFHVILGVHYSQGIENV